MIDIAAITLNLSEHGIALVIKPIFNEFQPLFEIDINMNVLVQGKIIGRLEPNGEVIFF